eukprot:688879_1
MSTPKRNWFLGPNKFSQTAKYEILLTDKKWHQVKITDKQQDNVCSTITLTTRDTKQSFNYRKPSDQPKVDYVGPCRLRRVNKRETVMYRYKQSYPYSKLLFQHTLNDDNHRFRGNSNRLNCKGS